MIQMIPKGGALMDKQNKISVSANDDTATGFDEYGAEKQTEKKKQSDFWPKVLSVLAAVILWFYVVGIESPVEEQTFSDVPVILSGLPSDSEFSVISGYDSTVSVTLSGKRGVLSKIKPTDIKAYVDLSGVNHAGEFPLNIEVRPLSGTLVNDVYPSIVYAYIDKTITKSVPVEVDYTGGTTDIGIIIDELVPSLKTVSVKGPAETVEKIVNALIYLDIGFVDRSFEVREKVSLVDKDRHIIENPYITLSDPEMKVTVNVNKYKTIPIKLKTSGVVDSKNIKYTISPESVTVKGLADIIDKLEFVETELVDETKIDGEAVYQLKLSLPQNVTAKLDSDSVKANISLINNSSRVVTLASENIFPTNENSRFNVTLNSKFMNINLRGDSKELLSYNTEQIYAQYDVSSVGDAGIVKIPIKITLPNSEKIYVSGDYYVEVSSVVKKRS